MLTALARRIAIVALVLTLAGLAYAADASAAGKWTWTLKVQDNEIMQSVELKQDGEKLTGTFTGRNNSKSEVKDGKVDKDGNLSFYVLRDVDGQEIKLSFTGKLKGADAIEGKIKINFGGEDREVDWKAARAKAP